MGQKRFSQNNSNGPTFLELSWLGRAKCGGKWNTLVVDERARTWLAHDHQAGSQEGTRADVDAVAQI